MAPLPALFVAPLFAVSAPPAGTSPAGRPADAAGVAALVRKRYEAHEAARVVPLLCEVLRFPTVAGDLKARADQQAWLGRVGRELGFSVRDAGMVTEIDLPGPKGAPVLGLVVHGDVQPVEPARWTIPPFEGVARDGFVLGRGAADDKGPLVQALLAMKSLKESGARRTHGIRMLVGSDEESGSRDLREYLASHKPPDYSLVLDSEFPVVVGEMAWNALLVATELSERPGGRRLPYEVAALEAGQSPSIVPDHARIELRWKGAGTPDFAALRKRLAARPLPDGTALRVETPAAAPGRLDVIATGKAAHGGVNLAGGRNALVALARALEGELPRGGADDLLGFARLAGQDLHGSGLGLTETHPLWGRYSVNVAMIKPGQGGKHVLTVVTRRTPPLTGPELRARLEAKVAEVNARTGAQLTPAGFYDDEPLSFDPDAKLVKRLMAAYTRATGETRPPAISAGGTYAKRLPSSIAFGMWFGGKPYPGHDVDEKVPIADLHRGAAVLIEALVDLACGPPLREPFKP